MDGLSRDAAAAIEPACANMFEDISGFRAHLRGSPKPASGLIEFTFTAIASVCTVEYIVKGFNMLTFEVAELVDVSIGELLATLPTRRGTLSEDDLEDFELDQVLERMADGNVEVTVQTAEGTVLTGRIKPVK